MFRHPLLPDFHPINAHNCIFFCILSTNMQKRPDAFHQRVSKHIYKFNILCILCSFYACYAASKSYVISFSRAMSCELKSQGIDVMAVCPGPVATDFQRRATEGKETDFNDWRKNFVIDPVKLARKSLSASVKGRRMLVYPFSQKLLHLASKIVPVSWILAFESKAVNE